MAVSLRGFGRDAMDEEFCKERVRTVRALAEQADPFIKLRLLQLLAHYERRIERPDKTSCETADVVAPFKTLVQGS